MIRLNGGLHVYQPRPLEANDVKVAAVKVRKHVHGRPDEQKALYALANNRLWTKDVINRMSNAGCCFLGGKKSVRPREEGG